LAARAQLVDPRRRIGAYGAREHVALPDLGGQGERLKRHEHLAQPVHACAARRSTVDPLPLGQEACERTLLCRLDLLAERGERGSTQPSQHLRVAPLALAAAGPELAANELAGALQLT